MPLHLTTRAITLPALLLGSIALTACSGQGFGTGTSYASANCAPAQSCGGRYGHGEYNQTAQNNSFYGQNSGQYGALRGQNSGLRGQYSALRGKSRYGTTTQVAGYQQEYYMQQQMVQTPYYAQPSYQTSYAAPAAVQNVDVEFYTPTTTTSYAPPANCPAGTTAQSDGTCLQGSSTTSYASTSTSYATSTPSYSSGYITTAAAQNCPAGTTAQSDGTCLQGGSILSGGTSSYSTPSYTQSYSASDSVIAPPISEYDWGSNDTTWGSDSYVSPGSRTVDAVNSYPSASVPSPVTQSYDYNYQPFRK